MIQINSEEGRVKKKKFVVVQAPPHRKKLKATSPVEESSTKSRMNHLASKAKEWEQKE